LKRKKEDCLCEFYILDSFLGTCGQSPILQNLSGRIATDFKLFLDSYLRETKRRCTPSWPIHRNPQNSILPFYHGHCFGKHFLFETDRARWFLLLCDAGSYDRLTACAAFSDDSLNCDFHWSCSLSMLFSCTNFQALHTAM
jgi:hypothetical protein